MARVPRRLSLCMRRVLLRRRRRRPCVYDCGCAHGMHGGRTSACSVCCCIHAGTSHGGAAHRQTPCDASDRLATATAPHENSAAGPGSTATPLACAGWTMPRATPVWSLRPALPVSAGCPRPWLWRWPSSRVRPYARRAELRAARANRRLRGGSEAHTSTAPRRRWLRPRRTQGTRHDHTMIWPIA